MTRLIDAVLLGWSVSCLYGVHACTVAACPCECHQKGENK
jgi:hypothetical protein